MRNLLVPFAFVAATTGLACSFQMKAGGGTTPQAGQPGQPGATTPAAVPTPAPKPSGPTIARMGRKNTPGTNPAGTAPATTPTGAPTTAPTAPAAGLPPTMSGANPFGTGTPDLAGWKGTFFAIPAGATKLPDLGAATPGGFLFAKELDVKAQAMSGGFPGIDPNKNEDFAIRWEAPLVVETEATWTFRIVSDDGAKVLIDGTPIVENDAANPAPTEKSGPVHLVVGTHQITVDYFQTKAGVALQLFCKTQGGNEKVCPLKL
jgi:hypothetical protein